MQLVPAENAADAVCPMEVNISQYAPHATPPAHAAGGCWRSF